MSENNRRFVEWIAERLRQESRALCTDWLHRLSQLLPMAPTDILPSEDLLDHIPAVLAAVSDSLAKPDAGEVSTNSVVMERAKALGTLRYSQNASVHQILREYDILAMLLSEFVVNETEGSGLDPSPKVCLLLMTRLKRAVRILMQTTVDTYIDHYVETIELQKRRLADFNRVVSHELRNPMNTLQVAAELLAATDPSDADRQKRLAGMVQAAVKQMRQLLEGVEKLSMGSAPAQTDSASVQRVDLASIARDAANQLDGMAKARQVEVRIAEDLPNLAVDVAKLEMVFVNLLANAIKYSDPAKSARYVDIIREEPSTILVRDNGIGIPPQFIDRVFERFYRAHEGRDTDLDIDGSGLGLSIVKECMEDLGGSIEVESIEGQSTQFRLRFPRQPSS
jgi:signal transduction histidine kinase